MSEKKKESTEIFSIDDGGWNQEIPGVTQLLSMSPAGVQADHKTRLELTRTQQEAPPTSMKDLGVVLEHHFKKVENHFIYDTTVVHTSSQEHALLPWQKAILSKMRLDLNSIPISGPFYEYQNTQKVMNEIFASAKPYFIQLVHSPVAQDRFVVLQTPHSLDSKKEFVISFIEPSGKGLADAPIEIDLAS